MKIRYILFIAATIITIISCKKDGGGSISLKIKSISSNLVPVNGDLEVIFDFTDNGGHPIDSIYMLRKRINQQSAGDSSYPFGLTAPSYSGTSKGQLQIDLSYSFFLTVGQDPIPIDSAHNEPDSLVFKFIAVDAANNKSDTATTGVIVVQR